MGQCNTNLITCRADQQHSPPDCFLPVPEDHFVLSFAQLLRMFSTTRVEI